MLELNAEIRELSSKLDAIRASGYIPAEIYGKKFENKHIVVSAKEFERVFKEARENTVIDLKIKEGEVYPVIIHNFQKDHISGKFISVDFFRVRYDEKIIAPVPIVFIGESSAVKEMNGILIKSMDELEVKALPSDLPHDIKIDTSLIKEIGGSIYIKDIPVSDKYEIIADLNTVVATVIPPKDETEEVSVNIEEIATEGEIKRAESEKEKE